MFAHDLSQETYRIVHDPVAPSVLASWVRSVCQTIRGYGCDPQPLVRQAGLNPEWLNIPEARYPVDEVRIFWQLAIDKTQDSLLGLRVGQEVQAPALHALGLALMASSSLTELMELLTRYCKVISSTMQIGLEHDEHGSTLTVATLGMGGEPMHAARIALLAFVYREACKLSQHPIIPAYVTLAVPRMAGAVRLNEHFNVAVTFDAGRDAIRFSAADTAEPYACANAMLIKLNERAIQSYLERVGKDRFSDRVLAAIEQLLPQGEPRLDDVAAHLEISVRTLQRKLVQEQQSFITLLDLARYTLADDWLSHSSLAVVEIGYRLGFSNPSNFCRACHRWFACSPKKYRQQRLQTQL